jgi:hypothetical protein
MAVETVTAKKATKVTGNLDKVNIVQGLEKPKGKGEVAGHMSPYPGAFYNCWYDEALNWVEGGCDYFICRVCLHLNRC